MYNICISFYLFVCIQTSKRKPWSKLVHIFDVKRKLFRCFFHCVLWMKMGNFPVACRILSKSESVQLFSGVLHTVKVWKCSTLILTTTQKLRFKSCGILCCVAQPVAVPDVLNEHRSSTFRVNQSEKSYSAKNTASHPKRDLNLQQLFCQNLKSHKIQILKLAEIHVSQAHGSKKCEIKRWHALSWCLSW